MAQEKSNKKNTSNKSISTNSGAGKGGSDGSDRTGRSLMSNTSDKTSSDDGSRVSKTAVAKPQSDDVGKSPSPESSTPRRRPAAPARARIAANDDRPSIGGLIYALQERPSNKPFFYATILSGVWALLGLFLCWIVIGDQISKIDSVVDVLTSPATIIVAATTLFPIALFWFLALLQWRAQELRLMSSAMTEVAVRLAEPDRMAEQSVASLGQVVRRQVAAMNDAIARALGRAGELEALVHNEVAALERSYSENENRIRRLIEELATERDALTNNSNRMGESIRGIGVQVAREIVAASEQVTHSLSSASDGVAEALARKGEKITAAMSAAGASIDERLTARGSRITEQLITQGAEAANRLKEAGNQVNKALKESSDQTAELLSSKGNKLVGTLSSINQQISKDVPALLDRLGSEQIRLGKIIEGAVRNLAALDGALTRKTGQIETSLGQRTQHLQHVVTEQIQTLDRSLSNHMQSIIATLGQRTEAIDAALVARTRAIDHAFSEHVKQLDSSLTRQSETITNALAERSEAIQGTLSEQAAILDQTFMKGVMAIRSTTDNLASEQVSSIEALASQAEVMKNVSEGLLQQVHTLTRRFESQGQSIMKAAHALESSQFKMDAVLESRQTELTGLLEVISTKAVEIDSMMQTYAGQLQSSLSDAQVQAKQLSTAIAQNSESASQQALLEIEKMRMVTQSKAEAAVNELRDRFASVTKQVTQQIGSISNQFSTSTQKMQDHAAKAAGELEAAQSEIKSKIDQLPQTTQESAAAIRQALRDQLQALESLNAITTEHGRSRDISLQSDSLGGSDKKSQAPDLLDHEPLTLSAESTSAPVAGTTGRGSMGVRRPQPRRAGGELEAVARSLTQKLNKGTSSSAGEASGPSADEIEKHLPGQNRRDGWSMGDLLARASETEPPSLSQTPPSLPGNTPQRSKPAAKQTKRASLNMDTIARAIDNETAFQVWQRFRSGDRGVLSRGLYTHEGQATFDEIQGRYKEDRAFRETVDRYLIDFERLLREADNKSPGRNILQNYLMSETGRVYLLLAHASGRLA